MLARLSGFLMALLLWALALSAWAGVAPVADSHAAEDSLRQTNPAFVLPVAEPNSETQRVLGKRSIAASASAPSVQLHPHGCLKAAQKTIQKTIQGPDAPPKPKKKKKKGGPLPYTPTTRIGIFMLIVAAGFTTLAFIVISVLMALNLTTSVFFTYLTFTFFVSVFAMLVGTILMLAGGLLMKQK